MAGLPSGTRIPHFDIQEKLGEGGMGAAQDVNNNRVIKFDLLMVEDRIKGEATMSADGESRKAKLDVGRVK